MEKQRVDFISILPKEIVENIFRYLSATELGQASCCSKEWRNHANQDPLWLHHCMVMGWLKYGIHMDLTKEEPLINIRQSVSGTSPVFSLDVSDDSMLAPIGKWKEIYVRALHLKNNWATGRYSVAPILRGHKEKVTALDCNGQVIVSGSADKSLRIWDLSTCKCISKLDVHSDTITAVKIKHNVIVTGCADCSIRVFDSTTNKMKMSFLGHTGSIDKLTFDGEIIISASSDKTVKVWSLSQAKLRHTLLGHTDEIECLSTFGNMAVTGGWDNVLFLWDIQTGAKVQEMRGHEEVINCCQFDDKKIVSGSADGTVRCWSPFSGANLKVLKGHTGEVYCLVYNKDMIASGASDSTIRIWDHTGEPLHVLTEHIGVVRLLHLDSEEARLVSGGDRKKIVVWDYQAGKLLNVVHRHPSLLHLMWINETKLITASPEKPGTITVLSYW